MQSQVFGRCRVQKSSQRHLLRQGNRRHGAGASRLRLCVRRRRRDEKLLRFPLISLDSVVIDLVVVDAAAATAVKAVSTSGV